MGRQRLLLHQRLLRAAFPGVKRPGNTARETPFWLPTPLWQRPRRPAFHWEENAAECMTRHATELVHLRFVESELSNCLFFLEVVCIFPNNLILFHVIAWYV